MRSPADSIYLSRRFWLEVRPLSLAGCNVLVTGGSSGIGLACARQLLRDGATVTIAGRSRERLEAAASSLTGDGPEVRWTVCDVTDEASVAEAVAVADSGDGLRVVVASAGVGFIGPIAQTPLDGWRHLIDTNLTGVFVTLKHTVAALRRNGGGAFTAISSLGAVTSTPYASADTAAKAGVDMLVRTAAQELNAFGIRVNAVRPGPLSSDSLAGACSASPFSAGAAEAFSGNVLVGHLGTAEEVAAAVSYLSCPSATWLTGTCVNLDGGGSTRRGPEVAAAARRLYGHDWVV